MATYEVNFSAAKSAASHLETILEQLQLQIKQMNKIEETMLNDSLWYGPNKSQFKQNFTEYKSAMNMLYNNAVEHLNKLNEMLQTYAKAEMN